MPSLVRKNRKEIGLIFLLISITIISKMLGLCREILLAYFYGTSEVVDAFVLSTSVPTIIFGCLDAVAVTIVPIYVKNKNNCSQKKADHAYNNIVTYTFVISIIVLFLTEMLSPIIAKMFSNGEQDGELLYLFLRITLFTVVFNPLAQLYLSILRCDGKQIRAQILDFTISGVQIVFIVFSALFSNSMLLPLGYLSATVICAILSYIISGKRFQFVFERGDTIYDAISLVIPAFLGNTIVQLNAFIDKLFASTLANGMISALNYANIIKNLFYALLTAPIINVYYPQISAGIAQNDRNKVSKQINEIVKLMIMLLIPCVEFCILYSKEFVRFLFFRGVFDTKSLNMTSAAFRMYSIGIVAICIRELFVRCYYCLKKTNVVIILNLLSVGLNILLNMVLIENFMQVGIALATSLSAIIVLPFWAIGLEKESIFNIKKALGTFIKYFLLSIPVIIVMILYRKCFVFPPSMFGEILYFALLIVISIAFYTPALVVGIKSKKM